jgi:hypothetical protein
MVIRYSPGILDLLQCTAVAASVKDKYLLCIPECFIDYLSLPWCRDTSVYIACASLGEESGCPGGEVPGI